jgi:hypothetical protein
MSNGSYYMLTRVKTHAGLLGHNEKIVLQKVDSMLYENIPGKILNKTAIAKNGYKGFSITNRTRRGDIQRYEILVTPHEVLVFKMSGNDGYVKGKEAEDFFSSIKVKPVQQNEWADFEPAHGGFKVKMPGKPTEAFIKTAADGNEKWEYETIDLKSGTAYHIWKKNLYNFNFLEEDTFDLSLIEESIKGSEIISKTINRKTGTEKKLAYLDALYKLKDNGYLHAKVFLKGPHYYLLMVRTKDKKHEATRFFNSFKITDYKYHKAEKFVDSSLQLTVYTPVKPLIDTLVSGLMNNVSAYEQQTSVSTGYSGWPKNKTGIFKSDSTGESILVTVQTFPKYYYSKDSSKFWKEKLEEKSFARDFIISKKQHFKLSDSVEGYDMVFTDTNSSKAIRSKYILSGNNLYKLSTLTDTSAKQSTFVETFFATALPIQKSNSFSVFSSKVDVFFKDYYNKDSALAKQASQAIPSIYFGKPGLAKIVEAIDKLKFGDKDYFETKSKFITELGYINDSSVVEENVNLLKNLYEKNADISYFQNAVLASLARLKTKSAYKLLKELLITDPPVFDNNYEYDRLFSQFADTLPLSKTLFPDLLQLSSIDDYKPYVNTLLKSLVDSGLMVANDYENYFSKIYFDAKIELKKQQNKDERQIGIESNEGETSSIDFANIYTTRTQNTSAVSLYEYAVLLMPFYDKQNNVPKFFEKMLASKDVAVQMIAIKELLAHNKKVPANLISSIAAQDQYRATLLQMLVMQNRQHLFPEKFKKQVLIAKSLLLMKKV